MATVGVDMRLNDTREYAAKAGVRGDVYVVASVIPSILEIRSLTPSNYGFTDGEHRRLLGESRATLLSKAARIRPQGRQKPQLLVF